MGLWDSIKSVGKILVNPLAALGGSIIESKGQSSANAVNVDIMREQQGFSKSEREATQEWTKEMSNTAHQRQVKDMIAAGLNPILSVTGGKGASTPGGGFSVPSSAKATNIMEGKGKTSIAMMEALSRIRLNKSNTALTTQATENEKAKTIKTSFEANSAESMSKIVEAQRPGKELAAGRRTTLTGQFLDWTKEYFDTLNPFAKRRKK